ncbi:MAG: recombinase family protein [Candidatus Shapirobacteria bacterium]|nr:recombinase family protein [Candidatus Shapirobacteria bacterium]
MLIDDLYDGEVDTKKLRYRLYVRKSRKEDGRQFRSFKDQIKACRKFAEKSEIPIVGKAVREKGSAKIPGKRPKFDQLLRDVKDGKIDGIIAYHPDRLSRNMLEGGVILNMIDDKIIKDLRFPIYHFTNNASGKLLLGITFALSKHYSDHLSQVVTRGNHGNFIEGKTP